MRQRRRKNEEGALLIILMVGVAVTMVGLAVAFQTWSTIWRRDNEEELIFRGKQYVEAIRAYRTEQQKFPLNLEELMKPGPRQVRYIRKLFRDPMKKKAKWGLLYVVPGGRAIYDPVAAAKAKKTSSNGWGLPGDSGNPAAAGGAGFTAVDQDPNGTGVPNTGQGVPPGGQPQNPNPNIQNSLGRGSMAMPAMAPPPMGPDNSDDEKAVSEPPIGWGIAGVISRVIDSSSGQTATPAKSEGGEGGASEEGTTVASASPTFKIFKGHEHVDEWQFQVFDNTPELADAPQLGPGRGTNPTFLGPGFGGQGPISGVGSGRQPGMMPGQGMGGWGGGAGGNQGSGGNRQQNPNGWYPGTGGQKGNRNQ